MHGTGYLDSVQLFLGPGGCHRWLAPENNEVIESFMSLLSVIDFWLVHILTNCCLSRPVSPESLEVHGAFTWLGQTQYKLQLRPQEVHQLSLKACFFQAGVYNLGTARIFAKLAQSGTMCETSQQSAMPALIIINSVWSSHLCRPAAAPASTHHPTVTILFQTAAVFYYLFKKNLKNYIWGGTY